MRNYFFKTHLDQHQRASRRTDAHCTSNIIPKLRCGTCFHPSHTACFRASTFVAQRFHNAQNNAASMTDPLQLPAIADWIEQQRAGPSEAVVTGDNRQRVTDWTHVMFMRHGIQGASVWKMQQARSDAQRCTRHVAIASCARDGAWNAQYSGRLSGQR